MNDLRTLPITFHDWDCYLTFGSYNTGALAIRLLERGTGEPIAIATVNISKRRPPFGHVYIKDWSENEGMMQAFEQAGYLTDTGYTEPTGMVEAKIALVEPALYEVIYHQTLKEARREQPNN